MDNISDLMDLYLPQTTWKSSMLKTWRSTSGRLGDVIYAMEQSHRKSIFRLQGLDILYKTRMSSTSHSKPVGFTNSIEYLNIALKSNRLCNFRQLEAFHNICYSIFGTQRKFLVICLSILASNAWFKFDSLQNTFPIFRSVFGLEMPTKLQIFPNTPSTSVTYCQKLQKMLMHC